MVLARRNFRTFANILRTLAPPAGALPLDDDLDPLASRRLFVHFAVVHDRQLAGPNQPLAAARNRLPRVTGTHRIEVESIRADGVGFARGQAAKRLNRRLDL